MKIISDEEIQTLVPKQVDSTILATSLEELSPDQKLFISLDDWTKLKYKSSVKMVIYQMQRTKPYLIGKKFSIKNYEEGTVITRIN